MSRKRFPTIGSKAETKSLAGLFRNAAPFKILARGARRGRTAFKLLLPPGKRPLIQLNYLIAVAFARFKAAVVNHFGQRHTGFFRDNLNCLWKSNAFDLHDEVENRAALL